MPTKVIVIGGGVAGMSAAHELARRGGFEVVVYEQRAVAGGKARSLDAIPGAGGRRALPGEHGFRFFPGFYRHLPDTMAKIPYVGQLHGVFDNLVTSTQVQIAREGHQSELVAPAHFPDSPRDWEAVLRFALEFATHAGIPLDEQIDQRDQAADQRDHAGDQRDHAAEQRDHAAEQSEARVSAGTTTDALNRSALARREAASDRMRASQDRLAGASERIQAELDRNSALADRGASARERQNSSIDDLTGVSRVRGSPATLPVTRC